MASFSPATLLLRRLHAVPRQLRSSKHLSVSTVSAPIRRLASKGSSPPRNPVDPIALHRFDAERRAYYKRRSYYYGAGFVAGMIAIWLLATSVDLPPKPARLDAPLADKREEGPPAAGRREIKVLTPERGVGQEERADVVETGTSAVPAFPRLLEITGDVAGRRVGSGTTDDELVEYRLLGLGIRTVSFLGIQVYVVGMYVALDDIPNLQAMLIKRIDPIATTLVAGEKKTLANALLDPKEGEDMWNHVLKDARVRTVLRVVPVRDTDFAHLRDGWVRAIEARARRSPEEFGDESLKASVNDFKALFRKGRVPKRRELLLARKGGGEMVVWYADGTGVPQQLGEVKEEKISRAIWLNYLAGEAVASEAARKNIIKGIVELVERPVGTVVEHVSV